jgi:hypothetical protein
MSAILALIATAVSLPASLSAQTSKWEQIWDQPDVAIIYLDRASIVASGELRSISTRTVYKGDLPRGYIAERIRIEEFDCKNHQSRIRHVEILAADGRPAEVIDWSPSELKWSPVEPDSLGEAKSKIACEI